MIVTLTVRSKLTLWQDAGEAPVPLSEIEGTVSHKLGVPVTAMAQNSPSFSTWSSSAEAQSSLCHMFGQSINMESAVSVDVDMDHLLAWQQLERVNALQCYPTRDQIQRPDVLQGSGDSRYGQVLEFQSASGCVDASSDLLIGYPEAPIFDRLPNRPEGLPESLSEGVSRSLDHRAEAPRTIRMGRRRRTDSNSPDGWVASKNLLSERKRREKLQKGLISLREAVPMFNMKMDKVSILTDAINHLQDLKRQIHELEGDCKLDGYGGMFDPKNVEVAKSFSTSGSFGTSEAGENRKNSSGDGSFCSEMFDDSVVHCDYDETSPSSRDWGLHLIQLDVIRLDHGVYKLDLICMDQSGILVQLCQAIEAFVIEIVHTSIVAITSTKITCTFIVKMCTWNDMTLEDVRADVQKLLGKSGLHFL